MDADERKPEAICLPTGHKHDRQTDRQPFHGCPRGGPAPQAGLVVPREEHGEAGTVLHRQRNFNLRTLTIKECRIAE